MLNCKTPVFHGLRVVTQIERATRILRVIRCRDARATLGNRITTSLRISLIAPALVSVCLASAQNSFGQQKVYRGSIGGNHIEMHLMFEGDKVTGTYAYDRVGEGLKLTGKVNAQGGLELAEFGANRKQTGKIMCKQKLDEFVDPECFWSRADGTQQTFVNLVEQQFGFTAGLKLVPKAIINRATGVLVSYPQLASDKPLSPGSQGFNQLVSAWFRKAIKDFGPKPSPHTSLELNYNVLLGTNDLVSFEITEYSDNGGAHPNNGFYSITYDLNNNRELKLDDILKTDSDYRNAIAKYVVADIQRRANLMEQQDAKREGRQPQVQDEPIVSMDQLSEISHLAITPTGLMIYFAFPNVISVFDRTFVPYRVVKEYLKPNGPAARFQNN